VKYPDETPLNNEYTLKNEGQDYKTGSARGQILVRGGGRMEGAKEGEYGQ
jgi:hypothetical protein